MIKHSGCTNNYIKKKRLFTTAIIRRLVDNYNYSLLKTIVKALQNKTLQLVQLITQQYKSTTYNHVNNFKLDTSLSVLLNYIKSTPIKTLHQHITASLRTELY